MQFIFGHLYYRHYANTKVDEAEAAIVLQGSQTSCDSPEGQTKPMYRTKFQNRFR